ncbi:glycosyl hydrolase family 18 protein [Silvibacterium sp.]|uniref:glycosyl hydrolase family 18 protein n=1 Tax=Silvibacterium sp. TaxID=1964179 RepID=UPI0039E61901
MASYRFLFQIAMAACSLAGGSLCIAQIPATPTAPRFVMYVASDEGVRFRDLAKTLPFGKITDLNLAFADPPQCDGVCSSASDMRFAVKGQDGDDLRAIVLAAHATGVKVTASIGGGGGDQRIIAFYNAGLVAPLVASLDAFVKQYNFDGVDLDIEDASNMGQPFLAMTNALIATFHPEGRFVTAAVAKYLQASMPDSALAQFDLLNVMNYSSYAAAKDALEFYAVQKKVPAEKLVLGVPFFGSTEDDSREESYKAIASAYANAWKVNIVGGGALDDGQAFRYVGESTMAAEVELGKKYGGVMVWELLSDAPAPHSLRKVIEDHF